MTTTVQPPPEPEVPPDLTRWVILVFIMLLAVYAGVLIHESRSGAEGRLSAEGLFTELVSACLRLFSFSAAILYTPAYLWAVMRRKPYLQNLGAFGVYLPIGCILAFFGSIVLVLPIAETLLTGLAAWSGSHF